ncbi:MULTISPECIES: hypothetical protein [unclassified Streptomyces]|uniref:hypothetical protein n=1 Tax=Streptomyces TaxID=1883 RepID=UPI000895265B|nr:MULTISPECIES: hypothetical protein [unclassified Streptomyces]PJJ01401.1 hypothetical protein BX264_1707 [Streptomyces sp. 2333.5]TXC92245.1 hypothetical protein FS847_33285 [Streptomyces sp. ISID311]SEC60385.1 hypothetical protein SAMN05428943_1852 [Streptomyces sp. 2314.4]SED37699.1 hypothetical protein SAMN05428942_1723 [Streptomyces sp. 2112.2]SOE14332.1 hypothetical protein SAMN06272775_5280 [Streptomyces sp. 2323.1]
MAKDKKQDRSRQQKTASAAERGQQEAQRASLEAQTQARSQAQGSPADVARKHQRRFGHN